MGKKNLLCLLAFALFPTQTKSQSVPLILQMLGGGEGSDAVRYVGGEAAHDGEDIGKKINEAYASLPPSGGTIIVMADRERGCYNFHKPIVAAIPGKNLLLEGASLTPQLGALVQPVCLNYVPTTTSSAITLDYVVPGESSAAAVHGIRNLTLVNNNCETLGGCQSGATGITIGGANAGAQGATYQGLRVAGFGTAVSVLSSPSSRGNLSFRDCILSHNATGFADVLGDIEHISFDACLFQGNGTAVSSSASITISKSSLDSNTALGVNCSSPAACVLEDDHFENAGADTTHFLSGNGVILVLGGDMRDDCTSGTTDWWMNLAGATFLILGTSLTSEGRTAAHVVLNDTIGNALIQTNNSDLTKNLYSNPQLVSFLAQRIDGSSTLVAQPSMADPSQTTKGDAATVRQSSPGSYTISGIKIVDGTTYPASGVGINQALQDSSNSGTLGGEVWLTTNVTANDQQISIPAGQTLRVFGSLTIGFPVLLGRYSHLTCNTNGGAGSNGNIIASQNMAQMVRAAVQDGSLETFYLDHCTLNGNGKTFSAPGVVDLGGMNDVGIVDDLNIFYYSGAAAIGAVDSSGVDPGPSHVNIDRIWANPASSAPCLSFVYGSSTSNAYIQVIHIGYFECQNSAAANPIMFQNIAPAGLGGRLRDISIDFLTVDGQSTATNNVLLDGVKRILIKFVRCGGTRPCVHITNNPNNQDIDLGMSEITGLQINVLDDANSITRMDPALYNYHFLNPNALSEAASVHLDNQIFSRLSVGGITNSQGIQLFNTSTTCETAASAGSTCTTAAITLPVAYSDTNYRLVCTGLSPTNVPAIVGATKLNTSFTLTIAAITGAPATYDSFDCIASRNTN